MRSFRGTSTYQQACIWVLNSALLAWVFFADPITKFNETVAEAFERRMAGRPSCDYELVSTRIGLNVFKKVHRLLVLRGAEDTREGVRLHRAISAFGRDCVGYENKFNELYKSGQLAMLKLEKEGVNLPWRVTRQK